MNPGERLPGPFAVRAPVQAASPAVSASEAGAAASAAKRISRHACQLSPAVYGFGTAVAVTVPAGSL